ncbi:RNA polymerase sigma factor [candidate division KSB1 bacterium]|nr:MAG: RNA polymerase sigma factor [candidate division KSB1 bacterium]MBC6950519.1 RNA polymerase sigma factor [candidate division KSB1 bacterium]MCE7945344.1 RNA polymerase sigma factor [Chlorobi bacterium CHB1]MDL1878155.1 RNA polymerase sigma factor [Cytophagia bacterium CHB2]
MQTKGSEREPAPSGLSEAELLAGCRAGQPQALAELVKRYQAAVLRVCISILGSRDVDDLVQEIFIKILQRLDRFEGRSALFTWIYEVTVNHCRDELRRRKRRRWFSLQALPQTVVENIPLDEKPVTDRIENDELEQRLHREINKLKPKYRELIVLRDLEGLSYEEIAQVCQIDVKLVKSRLYEARRILAQNMRNFMEEAPHVQV